MSWVGKCCKTLGHSFTPRGAKEAQSRMLISTQIAEQMPQLHWPAYLTSVVPVQSTSVSQDGLGSSAACLEQKKYYLFYTRR